MCACVKRWLAADAERAALAQPAISERERWSLAWLARQREPMWGGHLERGEPVTDSQLERWIEAGLIVAVTSPRLGYVLTDAGRLMLTRAMGR